MITVYRSETVITKTQIDAPDEKAALKFARAADAMPSGRPEYEPHATRSVRFSVEDPTADEAPAGDDGKPSKTKEIFKK